MKTLGVALDPLHFQQAKEVEFLPARFCPDAGETGAIKYRLAQPGIVRVYVRPKTRRFLVIRNLIDWERQDAGEHVAVWDGKDGRGNIVDPSECCGTVQSQPLRGTVALEDLPQPEELLHHPVHEGMICIGGEYMHAHTAHDEDKCHQLKVTIVEPSWNGKVSGVCRIVSQVSEDARGYGRHGGHSARYYVDYMVLHENKAVPGPVAVLEWDTRGLPNGKHVLSVAHCDHHDHMASDSIIVEVDNP